MSLVCPVNKSIIKAITNQICDNRIYELEPKAAAAAVQFNNIDALNVGKCSVVEKLHSIVYTFKILIGKNKDYLKSNFNDNTVIIIELFLPGFYFLFYSLENALLISIKFYLQVACAPAVIWKHGLQHHIRLLASYNINSDLTYTKGYSNTNYFLNLVQVKLFCVMHYLICYY